MKYTLDNKKDVINQKCYMYRDVRKQSTQSYLYAEKIQLHIKGKRCYVNSISTSISKDKNNKLNIEHSKAIINRLIILFFQINEYSTKRAKLY